MEFSQSYSMRTPLPRSLSTILWCMWLVFRMRAAITRRDAGRGGQPECDGQAADAAAAGFQWWGSSSAMRLAGCVGRRSSTSLMYA